MFAEGTKAKNKTTGEVTHIFTNGQWEKYDEETGGELVAGLVRSVIGQGTMLGFGDEAEAGVRSLFEDRPYEDIRDDIRGQNEAYSERHPVLSTAGEVGGGFLTGGLGGARALAAKGLTKGAKALRTAGVGAGTGGTAGAGYSEADTAGGVALDAGVGATLGGALGGAAPAIAGVTKRGIIDPVARMLPRGAKKQGGRNLSQAMADDGLTPEVVIARLKKDPNAVYADVGGKNMQGTAVKVAKTPGPGAETAEEFLTNRQYSAGDRVGAATAKRLGVTKEYKQALDDLDNELDTLSSPLYESAKASKATVNLEAVLPALEKRIRTAKGGVKTALVKARKLFNVGDGKEVDVSIRGLHETKMALDDLIGDRGASAIGNVARREVVNVKRALVSAMDNASDDYAKARNIWGGAMEAKNSLEFGRQLLTSRRNLLSGVSRYKGMTEGQKKYFRIGLAESVQDLIDSQSVKANVVRKLLDRPMYRKRLRHVFPNKKAYDKYIDDLELEARYNETKNRALSGSQTQENIALNQDMTQLGDLTRSMMRASADPVMAGIGLIDRARGRLAVQPRAVAAEMAPVVFGNKTAQNYLRGANARRSLPDRSGRALAGLLGSQNPRGLLPY